MKWNEVKRILIAKGYRFDRKIAGYDLYRLPNTGKTVMLERHWSQEARNGLLSLMRN